MPVILPALLGLFALLAAEPAARPLPFYYDLYTFRGDGGMTTVVSAFAVEAGELETERVGDGVRYRFSVTLVLADPVVKSVTNTHDTVFVRVPRPLEDEHLLFTHASIDAPPSTTTRQRVIMTDATTPGIGQLYSDSFPIPDYSGSNLMLSDIALGHPDANGGWRRGGATLALLPTSQFPSSAFDVYYEIYNMPTGARYTTSILIEPIGGGDPVTLEFEGVSLAERGGVIPELRRVETSLERGSYRITVTITNRDTGVRVSRSREFDVRGWDRGTTMVAAIPQQSGRRR